jgi:hypothetical protein
MQKFNVFDPILIRIHSEDEWTADFYDRPNYPCNEHYTLTGSIIADKNILPYNEETKYLHGTVGEFTKWVPKKGEPILVRDMDNERWTIRIFMGMEGNYFVGITDPETPHSACSWVQAKPYTNPFKE